MENWNDDDDDDKRRFPGLYRYADARKRGQHVSVVCIGRIDRWMCVRVWLSGHGGQYVRQ